MCPAVQQLGVSERPRGTATLHRQLGYGLMTGKLPQARVTIADVAHMRARYATTKGLDP